MPEGEFNKLKIDVEEIGVAVKVIGFKQLKAIVGLDFGDLKIRGFRINDTIHENIRGEKIWVTPPSYRDANGKYHPIFYIPDKELWNKIQFRIIDEYYKAADEQYRKQFDIKEDTP